MRLGLMALMGALVLLGLTLLIRKLGFLKGVLFAAAIGPLLVAAIFVNISFLWGVAWLLGGGEGYSKVISEALSTGLTDYSLPYDLPYIWARWCAFALALIPIMEVYERISERIRERMGVRPDQEVIGRMWELGPSRYLILVALGLLVLAGAILYMEWPQANPLLGESDPLLKDVRSAFYQCLYSKELTIPSAPQFLGKYTCPLSGNLYMLTFASAIIFVGAVLVALTSKSKGQPTAGVQPLVSSPQRLQDRSLHSE